MHWFGYLRILHLLRMILSLRCNDFVWASPRMQTYCRLVIKIVFWTTWVCSWTQWYGKQWVPEPISPKLKMNHWLCTFLSVYYVILMDQVHGYGGWGFPRVGWCVRLVDDYVSCRRNCGWCNPHYLYCWGNIWTGKLTLCMGAQWLIGRVLDSDRGAAGSCLTGVTALWPLSKTHLF